MSTRTDRVTGAMRALASNANRRAGELPPPPVETILRDAQTSAFQPKTWVIRGGAAAAVLLAGLGFLLLARPSPVTSESVPRHMTALVDSLYPESDYVHDELIDLLAPVASNSEDFLDDIWEDVLSGIETL